MGKSSCCGCVDRRDGGWCEALKQTRHIGCQKPGYRPAKITLTPAQKRVLQIVSAWDEKNDGVPVCLGRGMEGIGSKRNDEAVALRLCKMDLLDWGTETYEGGYEFWITERGRAILSSQSPENPQETDQ